MNNSLNKLKALKAIYSSMRKHYTAPANPIRWPQAHVSIQLTKIWQEQFEFHWRKFRKKIYIHRFRSELVTIARSRYWCRCSKSIEQKRPGNSKRPFWLWKIRMSAVSTGKYIIPIWCWLLWNQSHVEKSMLEVSNRTKFWAHWRKTRPDFGTLGQSPQT